MSEAVIHKSIFINASPEVVWEYLTDKDKLGKWFHPAEETLRAGAKYTQTKTNDAGEVSPIIWGRVLEAEAPHKLVTTFVVKPFGETETTVYWSLEAVGSGTQLKLRHEGIEAAAGEAAFTFLMHLDAGWDEHLGKLRQVG